MSMYAHFNSKKKLESRILLCFDLFSPNSSDSSQYSIVVVRGHQGIWIWTFWQHRLVGAVSFSIEKQYFNRQQTINATSACFSIVAELVVQLSLSMVPKRIIALSFGKKKSYFSFSSLILWAFFINYEQNTNLNIVETCLLPPLQMDFAISWSRTRSFSPILNLHHYFRPCFYGGVRRH